MARKNFSEGKAIKILIGKTKTLTPVLTAIGAYVTARSRTRFRTQRSPDGKAWIRRSNPNLAGIVADAAKGRPPLSRRVTPGPPGVDTGRLRNSIAFLVSGRTVTIGTPLDYAGRFNFGGESTLKITPIAKSVLAKWLSNQETRVVEKVAPLLDMDELTIQVPERRFIGLDDEDRKVIQGLVADHVSG